MPPTLRYRIAETALCCFEEFDAALIAQALPDVHLPTVRVTLDEFARAGVLTLTSRRPRRYRVAGGGPLTVNDADDAVRRLRGLRSQGRVKPNLDAPVAERLAVVLDQRRKGISERMLMVLGKVKNIATLRRALHVWTTEGLIVKRPGGFYRSPTWSLDQACAARPAPRPPAVEVETATTPPAPDIAPSVGPAPTTIEAGLRRLVAQYTEAAQQAEQQAKDHEAEALHQRAAANLAREAAAHAEALLRAL